MGCGAEIDENCTAYSLRLYDLATRLPDPRKVRGVARKQSLFNKCCWLLMPVKGE
jgi:hypothetical protein